MLKDWTIFNYVCDDDVMGDSSFKFGKDIFFKKSQNINVCTLNKTCLSKYTCKIINNDALTIDENIDHTDKVDMTDPFTLYNFIKDGMKECPAKKYCLFMVCHSQGWFMKHYKYNQLTVTYNDLFKKIKENKLFFDFIVISSCHTATLELMFEFRNITNYLIGCENPSPYYPYIYSDNIIDIISNSIDSKEICINICKDYIYRNNNLDDHILKRYGSAEPDISLLDVKYSTELIETIVKFKMNNIKLKDIKLFRIVPNDSRIGQESFVVYDLFSIITHYFSKDPNYKNFIKIFNKALIYYEQTDNLKLESTSIYSKGIGYTPCPYEHHSRGISYLKMDIYKYNQTLLSNCDILNS